MHQSEPRTMCVSCYISFPSSVTCDADVSLRQWWDCTPSTLAKSKQRNGTFILAAQTWKLHWPPLEDCNQLVNKQINSKMTNQGRSFIRTIVIPSSQAALQPLNSCSALQHTFFKGGSWVLNMFCRKRHTSLWRCSFKRCWKLRVFLNLPEALLSESWQSFAGSVDLKKPREGNWY